MLNAGGSKPLTGVVTLRTLSEITIEERGPNASPFVSAGDAIFDSVTYLTNACQFT
jgi:hypothetical protein